MTCATICVPQRQAIAERTRAANPEDPSLESGEMGGPAISITTALTEKDEENAPFCGLEKAHSPAAP